MENESCNEEIKAPKESKECGVELESEITYKKDESYFMSYKFMHQVYSIDAITLLDRSEYKQEYAQVITLKDEKSNCPFALKVEDEKLWEIIREMIND